VNTEAASAKDATWFRQAGTSKIFHLSFDIFHSHFGLESTDDKWQMKNDEWKITLRSQI
jgi:hypothetical protein